MSERDTKILEAARDVFERYGIGKTTMADIAKAAGISRQTLYNAYPGKAEVIRGVVRYSIDQTIDEVEAAWANAATFEEKLDLYINGVALKWYDAVQAMPDSAELLDGINATSKAEMQVADHRWYKLFEAHLLQHSPNMKNALEVADFIHATAMNSKYNSGNREQLVQRLDVLKTAVLAMIP